MIARNKNIHSQSISHLKKSHSKSMAIKIADSAIIDLVQPPLGSHWSGVEYATGNWSEGRGARRDLQGHRREIVSCIGSPSYGLSKHIASLISPLAGRSVSHVKHFINSIEDVTLEPNDLLVCFDVRSLFTNVPLDEVMFDMLVKDESLLDRTNLDPNRITGLLELCLKSTYFGYEGTCFELLEGAAMGSPVSPVVANLYRVIPFQINQK